MPPDPISPTPAEAARIVRAVRYFEGLPLDALGKSRILPPARGRGTWLPFANESQEEIPPYAVLQLSGADLATDGQGNDIPERPFLKATKQSPATPAASTKPPWLAVNSARPVPPSSASGSQSSMGWCTFDSPVEVLYNASGGAAAPAFGEVWGPEQDEWHVVKNKPGFRVLTVTKPNDTAGDKPGRIWCEVYNKWYVRLSNLTTANLVNPAAGDLATLTFTAQVNPNLSSVGTIPGGSGNWTGEVEIPVKGHYRITAYLSISVSGAGSAAGKLHIYQDNGGVLTAEADPAQFTVADSAVSASALNRYSAGAKITAKFEAVGSGTRTFTFREGSLIVEYLGRSFA